MVAKSSAENDERTRTQAVAFAEAIKPALDRMASSMVSPAKSGGKPAQSPSSSQRSPRSDRSPSPELSRKSKNHNSDLVLLAQGAWMEAILLYQVDIKADSEWDAVEEKLSKVFEQTATNRRNKSCVSALNKFLDRQKPRPTTPKSGLDKAKLFTKIIRKC